MTTMLPLALPACVPLERHYDVDKLTADLSRLRDARTWGLNRSVGADGLMDEEQEDWRILPLRSPGGSPQRTDAGGPGLRDFADTPWLAQAPAIAGLLAGIPAPLHAVRLMALGPGARVYEHRDGNLGIPWSTVRLHVPLQTNPGVVTAFEGSEHHWAAGRLWYGDFDRPHYVANRGGDDRIHLVIDCLVTVPLLELFPRSFLDALAWSEVLVSRDQVPLNPFELTGYCRTFPVPSEFLDWSQDGCPDEDLQAGIGADDGHLVLSVAGEPRFGLEHVGSGEFRPLGWSDERTLRLPPGGGHVTFTVRKGSSVTQWSRPAGPVPR
jgi:Aspartyl/Asparaginyl beta-hydroxylase